MQKEASNELLEELRPAGKLRGKCKYCDDGFNQMLIDEDGVDCLVSKKAGFICHAYEDSWFPCANPPLGGMKFVPLMYFDTQVAWRLKEHLFGVNPEVLGEVSN